MLDPARLVFIDETAISTNMVRLRGRWSRGERLVASGADDVYERIVLPGGGAPNARMPISGLPWQPDPYRISWDRRRATA